MPLPSNLMVCNLCCTVIVDTGYGRDRVYIMNENEPSPHGRLEIAGAHLLCAERDGFKPGKVWTRG